MSFNPDKCEIIRVTNKKKPTICKYMLHGVSLKETDSTKYLGRGGGQYFSRLVMGETRRPNHYKNKHSLNFIKRNIRANNYQHTKIMSALS